MTVETDSSGQEYVEVELESGFLRLTRIHEAWHGGTALRVQMRGEGESPRQGPDIPVGKIGRAFEAALKLFGAGR